MSMRWKKFEGGGLNKKNETEIRRVDKNLFNLQGSWYITKIYEGILFLWSKIVNIKYDNRWNFVQFFMYIIE